MLNVTQSSAVGFIEITVDETTGDGFRAETGE